MKSKQTYPKVLLAFLMAFTPALAQQAASPSQEDDTLVLNPFVVTTAKDRGYYSNNSAVGSKLPDTPLKDLPIALSILNESYLRDLNQQTISDTLQFQASWDPMTGQIRGLNALQADGNGISRAGYGVGGILDTTTTDRVEIFKGPASILYGRGQPGGTINIEPKKARFRNQRMFEVMTGQLGERYRSDFEQVVIPKKLSTRFNLQWSDQQSNNESPNATRPDRILRRRMPLETDYDKRFVFANTTTFRPTDSTEIAFDYEYVRSHESRGDFTAIRFAPGGGLPWYLAYGTPLDYSFDGEALVRQNDSAYFTLSLNQRVGRNVDLNLAVFHQARNNSGEPNTAVQESSQPLGAGGAMVRSLRAGGSYFENDFSSWQYQARVLGRFDVLGTHHKLLGQFNYTQFYFDFLSANDYVAGTTNGQLIDANRTWTPWVAIQGASYADLHNLRPKSVATSNLITTAIDTNTSPNYIASVVHNGEYPTPIGQFNSLFGITYTKLFPTMQTGVRTSGGTASPYQQVNQQKGSESKPNFGVVYQPTKNISIYALYAQSYQIAFTRNSYQEVLPNPEGESYEGGVKMDLLDGKLTGTVSVFDTKDRNRPLNDPTAFNINTRDTNNRGPRDPGFDPNNLAPNTSRGDFFAAGQFTSKGIDVDIILSPIENLQFTLGYVNADAKITDDFNAIRIGQRDVGNARETWSFFGNYKFGKGPLTGLTVGGGYRTGSSRFRARVVSNGSFTDYSNPGDDYTTLFSRYEFKAWGKGIYVQLNLDDVFNSTIYFSDRNNLGGAVYPIKAHTYWRLTTGVRF